LDIKRSPKVIPKNEKLCASARNASLKSRKSKRYGTLIRKIQKRGSAGIDGEFKFANQMEVPRIEKVVVNCGFGRMVSGKSKEEQKKIQDAVVRDLTSICGQKAVVTKARRSISSFKLREGQNIGAKVTLRRKRMWDFLERVITVALPRSRDFQGIDPKNIDQDGNLTFGIKEHIAFPEISPEKINFISVLK